MAKKLPNFSMDKTKDELDRMSPGDKEKARKQILSNKNNSNGVNQNPGPIGDTSNIKNPSAGKKELGNLSSFQNPAQGKFNIKKNNSAASNGVNKKPGAIKGKGNPSNGINKAPGAIKDYSSEPSNYKDWPLAKYSFEVELGGLSGSASFQAMDGLGASVGKMEFRDGNSPKFYKQSRPTLTSFDPCTLKKGVFVGDTMLYDWFTNVSSGAMFSDMRTVSIHLCEHGGEQDLTRLFTWTLEKAYITKYTPSGLDGEADSEVAIEEIEITYQSFSMNAGEGGLLGSVLGAITGAVGGIGGIAKVAGSLTGNVSGGLIDKVKGAVSGKISL